MLTPRNTVFPARTSGQSMLPPKFPGTIVVRTSPDAGATPRQPRNGARGTVHLCPPLLDTAVAIVRCALRSYRQVISGKSGASIAVSLLLTSAPKPGLNDDTA